jgi:hypothetical protein
VRVTELLGVGFGVVLVPFSSLMKNDTLLSCVFEKQN